MEYTSSQVSNKLKPITRRRLTVGALGEYAEILGVKNENRRPNLGGQSTYWWTESEIEKLKELIKCQ